MQVRSPVRQLGSSQLRTSRQSPAKPSPSQMNKRRVESEKVVSEDEFSDNDDVGEQQEDDEDEQAELSQQVQEKPEQLQTEHNMQPEQQPVVRNRTTGCASAGFFNQLDEPSTDLHHINLNTLQQTMAQNCVLRADDVDQDRAIRMFNRLYQLARNEEVKRLVFNAYNIGNAQEMAGEMNVSMVPEETNSSRSTSRPNANSSKKICRLNLKMAKQTYIEVCGCYLWTYPRDRTAPNDYLKGYMKVWIPDIFLNCINDLCVRLITRRNVQMKANNSSFKHGRLERIGSKHKDENVEINGMKFQCCTVSLYNGDSDKGNNTNMDHYSMVGQGAPAIIGGNGNAYVKVVQRGSSNPARINVIPCNDMINDGCIYSVNLLVKARIDCVLDVTTNQEEYTVKLDSPVQQNPIGTIYQQQPTNDSAFKLCKTMLGTSLESIY